ncbi:MAG TPA: glycosyltransferase family 9 protein [Longimicrobium sp.]|jgi:hypothetical protein
MNARPAGTADTLERGARRSAGVLPPDARSATLFYVTEPLDVRVRYYGRGSDVSVYSIHPAGEAPPAAPGELALRLEAPRDGRLTGRDVHLANSPVFFGALNEYARRARARGCPDVLKVLSAGAQAKLLAQRGMPARVGRLGATGEFAPLASALELLQGRRAVRVAVVNILHLAFGDTLLGLCALRELRATLEARFDEVTLDLVQHRCNAEAEALFRRSGLIDGIHFLPAPVQLLTGYDAYLDLTGERVTADAHWVDICMDACGLDPRAVPASRKRMSFPPSPAVAAELANGLAADGGGAPVLLFHPQSSTPIRTFPAERAARFVHELLELTGWRVASAVPLAVDHPRFLDWSAHSRTFDHFAHLVARADMVVSTDTCAYHLADAFDVPAVVLFTSMTPESRTAYYPYVEGIALQPEDNPLLGRGVSDHPAHVAFAEALWDRLDARRVVAAVEAMVARRRAARGEGDTGPPRRRRPTVRPRRAEPPLPGTIAC